MNESEIKQILLDESYVTPDVMVRAEAYAKSHNAGLIDTLLRQEIITENLLGQAIAEHLGIPFVDLAANPPRPEVVLVLPEKIAREFHVVLIKENKASCVVATDKLLNETATSKIGQALNNKKIILNYAHPEEISQIIGLYRPKLETRFAEIIAKSELVAPEILDQILADASLLRSSDIHFEPQEDIVVIRFRLDGVLHEVGRLKKQHYETIVNRIKVEARLRIDEHQETQDGAVRYQKGEIAADLRVSIVPTLKGETVVIRILGQYVRNFSLADLGLNQEAEKMLLEAAKKPFGMILATGPTGSGKTTMLYTLVRLLNDVSVNITTIEDPVEYYIPGLNQIQVNPVTNLTFAKGLRSIARQDPDIILVGEIRDLETADISVNAALTGHLLLSTFHANDAASSIPRLIDMGIEPFLLASTLELVISQRLVRKICESCKVSETIGVSALEGVVPGISKTLKTKNITLYKGKGCNACSQTGFKGRLGVYQFIKNSLELQDLISQKPSAKQIWELARSQGSRTLFEDGIEKVIAGVTTLAELRRVVGAG